MWALNLRRHLAEILNDESVEMGNINRSRRIQERTWLGTLRLGKEKMQEVV